MILLLFKLTLIAYVFCSLGEPGMIFAWYQKLLLKLPDYLAFPLGACFKCFVGQVSFWGYLIAYFREYSVLNHLAFVSGAIFLSLILNKLWDLMES